MILCYLFGCDGRSCYVFLALDRGVMELLPYNEQTSRELLPVGRIIADKKSILTLRDNELGDVHSCKGRVMDAEIWYRSKVEVARGAVVGPCNFSELIPRFHANMLSLALSMMS